MRRPRHTLHIVSGKGGTGKTTIAAALGCALATEGRRVLLCEVEGRRSITDLFGVELSGDQEPRLVRTAAGGALHGLSINAEDALLEYLQTFYRLGIAGRALDRFGAIDFATSIAPGLRDVLLTGKVYEAVRRQATGRRDAYDAVVLDAPPTGRIGAFLNVHEAVSGLARVGPIRDQADSIMRVLRSDDTVVHLVTLLEEMPVTETLEAIAELAPTGIGVGTVIANMVTTLPLPHHQLAAAARGTLTPDLPDLAPHDLAGLTREFAGAAQRGLSEQACRDRLIAGGVPMVSVAREALGVDLTSLPALAAELAAQVPGEVNA